MKTSLRATNAIYLTEVKQTDTTLKNYDTETHLNRKNDNLQSQKWSDAVSLKMIRGPKCIHRHTFIQSTILGKEPHLNPELPMKLKLSLPDSVEESSKGSKSLDNILRPRRFEQTCIIVYLYRQKKERICNTW